MSFIELVEGPLFYISFAIFVLAGLWRIIGVIRIGRKPDISPPKGSAIGGFIKGNLRHFFPRGMFARRTWVHIVGGYSFHLGLFVLMLFAVPHIKFLDERLLGFSWPGLPRWAFILVAEISFAGLIMLWVRRISDPVMRQISDRNECSFVSRVKFDEAYEKDISFVNDFKILLKTVAVVFRGTGY